MYRRDTRDYYLQVESPPVSEGLIDIARNHMSGLVLDFGGATGGYSKRLAEFGVLPVCTDLNIAYLHKADGLTRVACNIDLPFKQSSFDSAICFDVLEHLTDPVTAVMEINRIVKGPVIFTVPNCEKTEELSKTGLTFEHYLELSHRNYFDKESLRALLERSYHKVVIHIIDPVEHYIYKPGNFPGGQIFNKSMRLILKIFRRLGLIRWGYYSRLVAICE